MPRKDFDSWYKNMLKIGYLEKNDFDVIVAPEKKTGAEWRVVVVDGKISSASLYKSYGIAYMMAGATDAVIDFVDEVIENVKGLPPVYVIDVCESHTDQELKIIELNTFNSSGLYMNDVEKIILEINQYVEKEKC